MNVSNALVEFTSEIIAAAGEGEALKSVAVHADVYEEIKPGKTIRVDDIRQATPVLAPGRTIRKDNAVVNIFFIAMPQTQVLEHRLAARQLAEDMADAWLLKMFDDPTLSKRVCIIGQVSQFNDWIRPGTVKMPVCILRLQVNPRR